MTLIIGNQSPFTLAVNGEQAGEFEGVLLGVNTQRDFIAAGARGVTILDVGINQPAYQRLRQRAGRRRLEVLTPQEILELRALLPRHREQPVSARQAAEIFDQAVARIRLPKAFPTRRKRHFTRILQAVEQIHLDQLSCKTLAGRLHLSESRLRALLRQHMDCNISQYIRWCRTWKLALQFQQNESSLTELAHRAGFYDLSHADRAFNEIFGLTPSQIIKATGNELLFDERMPN